MLVRRCDSDLDWQRVHGYGLELPVQAGKATVLADLGLCSSLPVLFDSKVLRVGKESRKSAYSPEEVFSLRADSPCMLGEEPLPRAVVILY
jgi:hypothetical protein